MYYKIDWKSIDQGVEYTMHIDVLLNGLKLFHKYQPVFHREIKSPWYEEMSALYPSHTWVTEGENPGDLRTIFRRSNTWKKLNLIDESNNTGKKYFEISKLGRDVLDGKLSIEDVFVNAMLNHREEGENPFQVFGDILVNAHPAKLTPERVLYLSAYHRSGDDFNAVFSALTDDALSSFIGSISNSATRIRRVRSILNLLVVVEAVSENDREYYASNIELLNGLIQGNISDVERLFFESEVSKDAIQKVITRKINSGKRIAKDDREVSSFRSKLTVTDKVAQALLLEKSTRNHELALSKLIKFIETMELTSYENTQGYDLYVKSSDGSGFMFEVKSVRSSNVQKQLRSALAQLYEYRFRFKDELSENLTLVILLDRSPLNMVDNWIYEYLHDEHNILLLWWEEDELKIHPSYESKLKDFIQILQN